MFNNYTFEERVLIYGMMQHFVTYLMEKSLCVKSALLMGLPFSKVLPQVSTHIAMYMSETNIKDDDMQSYSNVTISKSVWNNMSKDKKNTIVAAMLELQELPEVKKNMAVAIDIRNAIKNALSQVDATTI